MTLRIYSTNLMLLWYFFKNISHNFGGDWYKIGVTLKEVEEAIYNEKHTLKRRWPVSTENFNRTSKIWKLLDSPLQALKKTESTTKNKCSVLLSSLYTELVFNTTL